MVQRVMLQYSMDLINSHADSEVIKLAAAKNNIDMKEVNQVTGLREQDDKFIGRII